MSSTASIASWHGLPNEMKLAIIDVLDAEDVKALCKVDQRTYQACVPAQFKKVRLDHYEALESFLENVPRNYCTHIEELELCTQSEEYHALPLLPRFRADAVIALLSATPRLTKLVLRVAGSLDACVLAPFPYFANLKSISVTNCGDEIRAPLSERFVVSMAASTRYLEELSLDHITRSAAHAPELEGAFPCVPLATNDEDIPDHPMLGSDLSLPSLLRIPTLRKLTIRDTHLGHEGWTSIPVACRLEVLDLGSCYHEDEGFNTRCTERIMAAVGPSVDEFSLTAAVSDSVFAEPSATPLPRLRKLHITPFFPVDSVVETVANLAGSPVEKISVQCFEEDVVDVCVALEEFLTMRMERGPEFYHKLRSIDVSVAAAANGGDAPSAEESEERVAAAKHLQDFCRDLQLAGAVIEKCAAVAAKVAGSGKAGPISFTDAKRFPAKGRSMSI